MILHLEPKTLNVLIRPDSSKVTTHDSLRASGTLNALQVKKIHLIRVDETGSKRDE